MPNPVTLTEQEQARLIQCLNQGIEPPPEFAGKLFSSVCGSLDGSTLPHRTTVPHPPFQLSTFRPQPS